MFASDLSTLSRQIEDAALNRHRHWDRITRCEPHEFPHRVERIHRLTQELEHLYAARRLARAKRV